MNASTKATTLQDYSIPIFVSVATLSVAMAKLTMPIAIRDALVTKRDHVVHFGTIQCTLLVCSSHLMSCDTVAAMIVIKL